jgi:hypothetical protein
MVNSEDTVSVTGMFLFHSSLRLFIYSLFQDKLSGSLTGMQPRMEGLLVSDEFERIEKGILANFGALYRHLGNHDKPFPITGHSGKN